MFDFLKNWQHISEHGELMLLQKVNKRHGIFNNVLISKNTEQLHSLRFDFLRHDQKWRIAVRDKDFGRIGWVLFWALGFSLLIFTVAFILPRQV